MASQGYATVRAAWYDNMLLFLDERRLSPLEQQRVRALKSGRWAEIRRLRDAGAALDENRAHTSISWGEELATRLPPPRQRCRQSRRGAHCGRSRGDIGDATGDVGKARLGRSGVKGCLTLLVGS